MKKIRHALKHDAEKDYVYSNGRMTALLYAAQRDHVDLVRELMSENYNASPSVPQTRPALLFAAENGSNKVLEFLTDTKNLSLSELDNDRDAVWFAARHGQLQAIELLIEAWKNKSPTDGTRIALKLADERPKPALVVAVEAQHTDVVKKNMVQHFRDANLTTSYAKALAKPTRLRNETALKALLTFDPNPETIRTQLCQWPLLHDAIATRKADNIIKFLAKYYRTILNTVDVFDSLGRTPLGLVAIQNDEQTASLLLGLGADPSAKRPNDINDKVMPFLLACKEGRSREADFRPLDGEYYISSLCHRKIWSVLDAQAFFFFSKLLALPEDVLEWLFKFDFLHFERKAGRAPMPMLIYALKAPTATPLKCLFHHPEALSKSFCYAFRWIVQKYARQNIANGITISEPELRVEIAGHLDRQLSQMPADFRETCKGELGSAGLWNNDLNEIGEVFRKSSFIIERQRQDSSNSSYSDSWRMRD